MSRLKISTIITEKTPISGVMRIGGPYPQCIYHRARNVNSDQGRRHRHIIEDTLPWFIFGTVVNFTKEPDAKFRALLYDT